MTLEMAVEILNRERHRGGADWAVHCRTAFSEELFADLYSFEAIAIAKEYERLRAPNL